METIEVWRGQFTTDTDGNPIQGKPARVGTFQAMVAPTSTTDQTEENANPRTIEYTIHIRGNQPTGIQPADLIKVRGVLLPVKGTPQVWNNTHGRHVGDVLTVGERKG
ncbi:head-tail adaptor protein [Bifidobacterium adolescentis]|uniref:head-tail adaptor protein n=1 Tax=Bifidobacterium adolescentis TaxID=1680 RepID=UPI0022E67443|nr:head-tail adaptor protein [Bifidobacterium adolescentis]